MDASPHLMAPTHEEEFKGDKRLASPQTRNSGYANSGHLIDVPRVRIVLPRHRSSRDSPLRGSGGCCEGEQPLHVVGHGHEVPRAADIVEAAEQELAEAER